MFGLLNLTALIINGEVFMSRYSPNIKGDTKENINIIKERASKRKDGVYNFRGVTYRVLNGEVTHYISNCTLYKCSGNKALHYATNTEFVLYPELALKSIESYDE